MTTAAASKLHRAIAVIAIIPSLSCCNPPRSELAVRMNERPSVSQAAPAARQMALTFQKTNYLLYLPEGYGREQQRWPLILYLHGKSLRGNDLEILKRYGLAALLEKDLAIPFIVVSPQCTPDKMWTEYENEVMGLLDYVAANYSVDRERIYLSGHSMGGRGTWFLAYNHPEVFAAIVPMSDAPLDDSWAQKLTTVPTWVFHGTKDDLEPFARTQQFVKRLKALGGEVKFTSLQGRDHYILDTYENSEIYDWLLRHRKKI